MSEITAFACGFNVRDWAYCDGSIQQIGQNPSLFDLIGTTFGGNGTTEFQLPDLRSRSIVGTGQGGGLTAIPLGGTGGAENVTLSVANLAAHDHTATFTPTGGSTTGTFIVKSGGASTSVPVTDNFIAGGVATVFSDGTGLGVTDVELSGLTISGGITGGTIDVEDTGSGTPFGVRDPYLGVGYQICVYGLYPARGT